MQDEYAAMKVLIAGSDARLSASIGFSLAQEAHEIIPAADCDEALNLFRRESPDFVLLDMNLAAPGALQVCVIGHRLRIGTEAEVRLTPLELKVLQLLFRAPGRTISSEKLSTHLWGGEGERERHTLKQLIYRLRGKLETAGAAGLLQTTPGAGYKLIAE